MSADVVVFWILALPAVVAFYLAYGVVEEIIQKRRANRKVTEPAPRNSEPSTVEPQRKDDVASAVRGYDTPELFRRDALIHIRHLESEAAQHERNIQSILAEMKKRERHE
jgi:flagellar biosynthesis/type III secretory pathway M-ring protein FliF/YscJ